MYKLTVVSLTYRETYLYYGSMHDLNQLITEFTKQGSYLFDITIA